MIGHTSISLAQLAPPIESITIVQCNTIYYLHTIMLVQYYLLKENTLAFMNKTFTKTRLTNHTWIKYANFAIYPVTY